MAKTTSGVKPTARQTGSARQQASTAGKATRGRKSLTPEQRKRKQERDRAYRLRKSRQAASPRLTRGGDPQKTTRGGDVPRCVCGGSAEASSDARKWLTEAWSSLKPGERQSRTFAGGGRCIQVEVMRGQPVAVTLPVPKVPVVAEPANVFERIAHELLDGTFLGPVRCGMDFAGGPMQVVRWLVPPEQALRWQIVSDVRAIVDSRRGWLHDAADQEEPA